MADAHPDPVESDPADETKRKFREALERKKTRSAGAAAHLDAQNKQSHAHGPIGGKREFRRKSG